VYSYLLYGISVWGATFETNLKRLQIFQNKIIGSGKYYDRATPYFVKNNILKICEIYELEVTKVMFRFAHYNKSVNLSRVPSIELQNYRKALSIKM